MSIHISLADTFNREPQIERFQNRIILNYPCDTTENCTYYKSTFPPGSYKLEVWGAEGGFNGGKGGYSSGVLTIDSPTNIYFFIGSKGSSVEETNSLTSTAFNGGGSGSTANTKLIRKAGSGGGATDIRLNGITKYHRVIVAGGGGGATQVESLTDTLGHGGGWNGTDTESGAKGGTENGAIFNLSDGRVHGSFGEGGSNTKTEKTGGGGGGGWFGGSSGIAEGTRGYGAGGSGYVLHKASFKPFGYFLNSSKYFLENWSTFDGSNPLPKCTIEYTETSNEDGHSGSGCIRITILSISTYKNCRIQSLNTLFILIIIVKN